jgi:hypothetical protein
MVGFVLSHSLKRYLNETADALELMHLPIRDFEEFRGDLLNSFGISSQFRRKKEAVSLIRSRMDWLRALDVALAYAAASRLRANLAGISGASPRVAVVIRRIVSDLSDAKVAREVRSFHMSGLAARIVGAASEVELQDQEDQARIDFPVVEKADNQRRRNEEAALERELNRIQRQAERKLVSPVAQSLLAGLTSHELFRSAVVQRTFSAIVRASFASSAHAESGATISDNVAELAGLLSQEVERPRASVT